MGRRDSRINHSVRAQATGGETRGARAKGKEDLEALTFVEGRPWAAPGRSAPTRPRPTPCELAAQGDRGGEHDLERYVPEDAETPLARLAQAAGVGFEPTGAFLGASGFQDRPIRPLWHPA